MAELHPDLTRERTVLITGATGFLGKYAVSEFLSHDYDVVAVGRNSAVLEELQAAGASSFQASLENLGDTENFSVDTVVHAAALSSPWGKWQDFYKNNAIGTQHVIDFCANNQVRRLVYVSSPSIYSGREHRLNITESYYDTQNRLNHYIRSKILAEQTLQAAHADGTIPELAIIRPRGLIGIGDPSMIPRLFQANEKIGIPLFNGGKNLVDLTCVENVALALRLAVEVRKANGKAYNITNGEPREFKSLLDQFFAEIHVKPRYFKANLQAVYVAARALETLYAAIGTKAEPPLTRYTVSTLGYSQTLDITSARTELGYAPVISLDEGIAKYAVDYRRNHV